jgi:AraC-like DNA-binding protein
MDSSPGSLAKKIGLLAQNDGNYNTAIPELSLFRRSTTTAPMACIYGFGIALTVQGDKRVMLGDQVFNYGPGQALLMTADLPVVSHVTRASAAEPYLGMVLLLESKTIVRLAAEMALPPPTKEDAYRAISLENLDGGTSDALARLLGLLDEPSLIPHIAPLLVQEIAMRLLTGPHSSKLRHFASVDSPSQKIIQSIAWLKHHFMHSVQVDELAGNAHMSPSTFRQHFKAVAGMSPVQYQKQLRLQEARQLMLNQHFDAGRAALQVGYESVSQFNREYCRLFGAPPLRDIKRMQKDFKFDRLDSAVGQRG